MSRRLIDNVKLNVHSGNMSELCYDVRNFELRNIVVTYTELTWYEFNIVVKTNCYDGKQLKCATTKLTIPACSNVYTHKQY